MGEAVIEAVVEVVLAMVETLVGVLLNADVAVVLALRQCEQ